MTVEFVAVVGFFAAASECALEKRSESGHRCAYQSHVDFETGQSSAGDQYLHANMICQCYWVVGYFLSDHSMILLSLKHLPGKGEVS